MNAYYLPGYDYFKSENDTKKRKKEKPEIEYEKYSKDYKKRTAYIKKIGKIDDVKKQD